MNNEKFQFTWVPFFDLDKGTSLQSIGEKYTPIVQIYAICFTGKDDQVVLIQDMKGKRRLPGGKIEPGETLEQAVKREAHEEARCYITNLRPLGVQKVENLGEPDARGKVFYQLRVIADVASMEEMGPDPDTGVPNIRIIASIPEAIEMIGWGKVGEQLLTDAGKMHSSSHS